MPITCFIIHTDFGNGPPVESFLRLTNGIGFCSGRVEVLHDGQWGTVCDDYWNQTHATVVCREIGCGNAIEAMTEAYFGEGSGEIWMDDVNCTGTESSLMDCETLDWGLHNCEHSEDAGVICEDYIRLINGADSCSGRVEVLHDGQWGTVCDDGWDQTDAAVVCRELNCGNVIEAKSAAYFGPGVGPVWMGDVQCTGTEASLVNCTSTKWGIQSYFQDSPAGPPPGKGEVLTNGIGFCSGRVEVLHDGQWGTVCDDYWDQTDATVVCREIGCGNVIEAKSVAYFGEGSGEIWMDNVNCNGTESSLMDCKTLGWGIHNCVHSEDLCKYYYIRLINGADSCSGRVEGLHDGQWGTVCDDGRDQTDAAVVCRELNCGNVIEAKRAAYFGPGVGPVWMGDVQCAGLGASLVNCTSTKWGIQSCEHLKDAGVTCKSEEGPDIW
uniref:Soluble scavenger receptor cysteine-rich domain-containing protein SSC5D n=1 Tax=Cyprinus carpio TaxID=7962 RepID=A0A8C1JV61_CYPCA